MKNQIRFSSRPHSEKLEKRDLLAVDLLPNLPRVEFGDMALVGDHLFLQTGRVTELSVVDIDTNVTVSARELHSDLQNANFIRFDGDGPRFQLWADKYYFMTRSENRQNLWATDGTPEGTETLLETDGWIRFLVDDGNDDAITLFTVHDGQHEAVWYTQGTRETTKQVTAFQSVQLMSQRTKKAIAVQTPDGQFALWMIDTSVPDGARSLYRAPAESLGIHPVDVIGSEVYFSVRGMNEDQTTFQELFVVNSETGDARKLLSRSPGNRDARWSRFDNFKVVGDNTFFIARAGHRSQVFVSNNLAEEAIATPTRDLTPVALTIVNDRPVFYSIEQPGLWAIDTDGSEVTTLWKFDRPIRFIESKSLGTDLLMDFNLRNALIQTDGTASGTQLISQNDKLSLPAFSDGDGNAFVLVDKNRTALVFESGSEPTRVPIVRERVIDSHATSWGAVVFADLGNESGGPRYGVYTTDGTPSGTFLIDRFDARPRPRILAAVSNDDTVFLAGSLGRKSQTVYRIERTTIADVNGDRKLDAIDIDTIFAAANRGSSETKFDINGDGAVTDDDVSKLISDHAQTRHGDANLDRRVDFQDFLTMSANFGKGIDMTWVDGDFNGDGEVGMADFMLLAANFGFDAFGD